MAGIHPTKINSRLAEIHQALIEALSAPSGASAPPATCDAAKVEQVRKSVEELQADVTAVGDLVA